VIEPSNALRANAVQLVDRYDLKAADALQLAAALEWCDGLPHGEVFLAADQRLREAAILSGFDGKVI
jgi:predicted nucleic acid-binding protein